jgi:MFS transporter, DHA1 family, inner membrane transport protein
MNQSVPEVASSTSAFARHRALLIVLAVGGFTSALNVTLLSPLLVDIARTFDVSEAAAGQLATLTAASSGLMAITVAPWMDRYPRRFWLRLECALLTVGMLISALAPGFAWMFLGRVIAGIGGAVIGASCLAACGDLFPDKGDRNRAIGLINSAFTLGAVVGLPIVTVAADWTDWRLAIALPAPLAALVFLGATRLPATAVERTGSMWGAWRAGYGRIFASRETVWLLAAEIGFMIVWFGWLIYFGAFAENVYATSAALLSLMFLVGGGGELIANNLAPVMMRRVPIRAIGYAATAIASVNLLLIGVAYDQEWTLFPFIGIGSAMGATLLLCLNIALLDSLPGDPGAVMSLLSACFELGGAIGVAVTGLALAMLDDYERTFQLLGAIMPIAALLLLVSARKRQTATGSELLARRAAAEL